MQWHISVRLDEVQTVARSPIELAAVFKPVPSCSAPRFGIATIPCPAIDDLDATSGRHEPSYCYDAAATKQGWLHDDRRLSVCLSHSCIPSRAATEYSNIKISVWILFAVFEYCFWILFSLFVSVTFLFYIIHITERNNNSKKGKGFPYSIPSVGPGADPGVRAVSLRVTVSHPPGGRLPLLSARPAVTSPAAEHHRPLAGTKLYCLLTEAHRCKQLA